MDLYNKEGIGLAIALDHNEIDSESHSSLYHKELGSDGVSKTSKTQSAEEYLKHLNQ